MAKNNTLLYVGGAGILALLFLGGGKKGEAAPKAPPMGPPPGDDEIPVEPLPPPPAEDPKVDEIPQEPPPVTPENWGVTPEQFMVPFLTAEAASGIPGFARYAAIRAWKAWRAGKALVDLQQAANLAAGSPNLCLNCHNDSTSEVKAGCKGIEARTLMPKGAIGPCGGKSLGYGWPKSQYEAQWKAFGSAGLFDVLSSTAMWQGNKDGFTPILNQQPEILYSLRAQLFVLGNMVHSYMKGSLKVLHPTSKETWTKIDTAVSTGSLTNQWALDAAARFQNRANEIGIDLNLLANPTVADISNWPGAESFWTSLATV